MIKFGFHETFVEMIMGFIDSLLFVALVNGNATQWLKYNVVLRQETRCHLVYSSRCLYILLRQNKRSVQFAS